MENEMVKISFKDLSVIKEQLAKSSILFIAYVGLYL